MLSIFSPKLVLLAIYSISLHSDICFSTFLATNLNSHPCGEFTLDNCYIDENSIIETAQGLNHEECQNLCHDIFTFECTFFIYIKEVKTCQLIHAPYQDYAYSCETIGGPSEPSIFDCVKSDDECKKFSDGFCNYDGNVIHYLELITSAEKCQLFCSEFEDCQYFRYNKNTLQCEFLDSADRTCNIIKGPPTPSFGECKEYTTPTPIVTSTTEPSHKSLKILAVGGLSSFIDILSDSEIINPFNSWNNCSQPSQYPYAVHASSSTGTTVCGGVSYNSSISSSCYSLNENSWEANGELINARYGAASTSLNNGSMWILGGQNLEPLDTTEIFDDKTGSFIMSVKLPQPMYDHCTSIINETHIFVAGNYVDETMGYIIDIGNDFEFTRLPRLLKDRRGSACATIFEEDQNRSGSSAFMLMVAGGFGSYKSEILKFEDGHWVDGWVEGPDLPRVFANAGYLSTAKHPMLLIGGAGDDGTAKSDGVVYQSVSNTFETIPGTLSTPRYQFSALGIETDEYC